MELEFSRNARSRMAERGIREDEIRTTLETPDSLSPCFETRWHARKTFGRRSLEVIYARALPRALVMTAYWQERP